MHGITLQKLVFNLMLSMVPVQIEDKDKMGS